MHCGQKIENIMSKVMNLDTSKMVNMMAFLIAILTPSIVSSGKWPPLYLYEMANNYDYSSVYLEHLSIWLLTLAYY